MSSTTSTTTKITKITTTSSTWDEISNEEVASAGIPLAIEQAGEFFSDQTSNTRKVFDKAVQEVVNEVTATNKEDEFKTYQQLKDKELSGADRAGSIDEENDKYKIIVDMKGFSAKDLKVTFINENELVVEGEQEKVSPDGAYSKQSFKRRFTLPGQSIIKEATSAFSSDNILTITVPKVTKEVSEKVVTETKALFKKDVKQTEQVQTVVADQQKQVEPAQPGVPQVPIIERGSFFTDTFFESVRKEFHTKVKEIVERRIKKVTSTTEESVYKNIRDTDTKENAVISVTGEAQDHKVVVDVHGYSKNDLKLLIVSESELTIQGRVEKKTNNSYMATSFKKSFGLPSFVDVHKTVAALSSEGVLTIVVPKKGDPAPELTAQTITKTITTKTTTIKKDGEVTEVTPSTDTVVSTDTQVTKKIITDQETAPSTDDNQTTKKITTTTTKKVIKKDGEEEVIPIEQAEPTQSVTQVDTQAVDVKKDTSQIDTTQSTDQTKIVKTTTKKTSTTTKIQGEDDIEPVVDTKETFDTQTETKVVGATDSTFDQNVSATEDSTQRTVKKITKTTITKRTIQQEGEEEEYEDDEPEDESQTTQTKTVVQKDATVQKTTTDDKVVPIEVKGKFLQDSTFDVAKQQVQTVVKDAVENKTVTDTSKQVQQTQEQKTQDTKTTKTTNAQIIEDTHTYKIVIDVFGYVEKEITIKITGDEISVEGKSEINKGGCISRKSFKKSFQVPSYVSINEATSAMSSDGMLTLTMPKKQETMQVTETKKTETVTAQKNVQEQSQTTNIQQQKVQVTETKKEDTTVTDAVQVQPKGEFYQDTFFKDTIEIFETALKNTLSRFQDDAATTTKQDSTFYKALRDKDVGSQTEAEGEDSQFHKIVIDVKGYKASDLKLKIGEDNGLYVEGKVQEAMSSKSFKKSFWLTDEFCIKKATAGLSADGILSIKVPRNA